MANIRVDDHLKDEADKMFDDVGMNTAIAVKIFLTRFVKTGKFPFEIETIENEPNNETISAFQETENILKNGSEKNDESLTDYFSRMKKEVILEENNAEL